MAFLLAFPLCAFFGLHFKPVIQTGMVDPYFYTGYIHNFADLFHRYGRTYFGVRFGLILPGRLFTWLLGAEPGFFALRYLLALAFGVPLYFVLKKHLNTACASAVYAISLSSPYLARALLWDHPDATGVPFLSAAICVVLLERSNWTIWYFTAGCIAAMAIHSNVFTVAIFGIFFACHGLAWIRQRLDFGILLRRAFYLLAGMAAITIAGTIYYWNAIGSWNIFGPTAFMAVSLSSGRMQAWRTPGVSWTLMLFHVLVPVWLAACCLIVWARRRRTPSVTAMMYFGLAVTAFYYTHQFLLAADTLQLFYYFSYAMPAVFLMFALITYRLCEQARVTGAAFAVLSVAAAVIPWLLLSLGIGMGGGHPLRRFLWVAVVGLVIISAAAHCRPGRAARVLALAGVIFLSVGFDLGFSTYAYVIQPRTEPDTSESDVYRAALQLIRAVPPLTDPFGQTLFWYSGADIRSQWVVSVYLWNYPLTNHVIPQMPGLPALTADQVTRIRRNDVRYLGLLCGSPAELQRGLEALTRHGIAYLERERRPLSAGPNPLLWDLLQLRQVPAALRPEGDAKATQ